MKRFFSIVILIILIYNFACANDLIYASPYLQYSPYPEIEAMGGATIAIPMNLASIPNNPASVDQRNSFGFIVSQSFHIQDQKISSFGLSYGKGKLFAAFSGYIGSVNDIEARTQPTENPLYTFDAQQVYFSGSLAYRLNKYINLGGTVRAIRETIDLDNMNTTSYDLGIFAKTRYANIGVAITNLGGTVSYDKLHYELPLTYSIGVSSKYRFVTAELTYEKPDIEDFNVILGTLFDVNEWLVLQSGFRFMHDTRFFSAGASFRYNDFYLSYSFVPYSDDLGNRHSIALSKGVF